MGIGFRGGERVIRSGLCAQRHACFRTICRPVAMSVISGRPLAVAHSSVQGTTIRPLPGAARPRSPSSLDLEFAGARSAMRHRPSTYSTYTQA